MGGMRNKGSTEKVLREGLEAEARALTDIGNDFMIRHSETTKIPLSDSA